MKFALVCFFLLASNVFAQDPNTYLKGFESKIYSLKSKGIKDFVVDIESSKVNKQINDQQIFGKIEKVIFRTYWTANPERLAVEIIGMPEGFKEVKEELKASISPVLENLFPLPFVQKFPGYKFSQGPNQREILAQDTTGIAVVPSFSLKFDSTNKLVEITGNKPIGTFVVNPKYSSEAFADGKWVLVEEVTSSSENGQSLLITKILNYVKSSGVAVLEEIKITSDQKFQSTETKPVKLTETITFKNYKIDEGEALKFFLAEGKTN